MSIDSRIQPIAAWWSPGRRVSAGAAVGLVVAGGVLIGLFVAFTSQYMVAAVIAAILLTSLAAAQFEASIAIYVLVAFVAWGRTPDLAVGGSGVGKGIYVSELMLLVLLMIWSARYILGTLPKDQIRSGFHVPIALYVAYCVLNVVHSYVFWDPLVDRQYQHWQVNAAELGLHVMSAGAFVLLATSLSSRKWLRLTTVAIMIPGLYQLSNVTSGDILPVTAEWWPFVVLLPACYGWAYATQGANPLWKRGAWLAVAVLAVFCVLVRNIQWVSGWSGLVVGLGVVTLIRSRRLLVVLLLLTLVVLAIMWPVFQKEVIASSKDEGDFDRFSLLAGGFKYASVFPLGVGLGNYRTYNTYHYGDMWGTTSYTSAHGTYSQHLAEMGFPGVILFVAILISGFAWLLRSYRSMSDRNTRTYLLAAMGQLAAIAASAALGDYIIPTYHNGGLVMFSATVYSWLAWGLAVAYVRLGRSEENGSLSIDR